MAVRKFADDNALSMLNTKLTDRFNNLIAIGSCSTAAATAAKEITIDGNSNWKLTKGSMILVSFTATNTAQNPTFNVNNTGPINIVYAVSVITTSNLNRAGHASRRILYIYDGTNWVWTSWSTDDNTTYSQLSLGQGYGTCATAAETVAKVVTMSSYALVTGGFVAVKFTYDVPANATMNINSKGAKAIYYRGAAITDDIIKAGDVAYFIYSTYYYLLGVDRSGGYEKPITGIPKTDLADDVQASLEKADSALQSHLTEGTGITISNNQISVDYGTTATTACAGNDSRLSNSRTPTSHASSATTYGVGTTSNYGHCMTINNLTTSSHADGKALSAYQGYVLNNKIKYGTSDYTAGTTALDTGSIYCVYE